MLKLISYPFSVLFALTFFIILLIFHPLQWIGLKFGYKYHKFVVDMLNWFIVKSLLIIGNIVTFKKKSELPLNTTLIFAANHQSMFDIPPLIWYLRKHHPKFVSKIELGKGIPSVSFNLRHGGAALINRKKPEQAIRTLHNFGERINKNKWSAAIFPEGTRSKTGEPKRFATNGLKVIIEHNPNAYIVPVSINNSWKFYKYGSFPLGMFNNIKIETHDPICLTNRNVDEVLKEVETTIKSHIIV